MEAIHVEVIFKEIIKPSAPPPSHLRTHKLSFLDQLAPPIYIPLILFYQAPSEHHPPPNHQGEKANQLKRSLSETLNLYYPLAGRAKEDCTVECDDEGVEFIEAKVVNGISLWEVIKYPNSKGLSQFLPFAPDEEREREGYLSVKLSLFSCGGFAIGVCLSHKIADEASLVAFFNFWAAANLGANKKIAPSFDAASFFSRTDTAYSMKDLGITKEKLVSKMFAFDKQTISRLQQSAAPLPSLDRDVKKQWPTRVEAVSAFIWERFMSIAEAKPAPPKTFLAIHAVDLRARMTPRLPASSFGNTWRIAISVSKGQTKDDGGICALASRLKNGTKEVDCDYVNKVQNSKECVERLSLKKYSKLFSEGEVDVCNFTSWCSFPIYQVDFGWGKPAWVYSPSKPYKNSVILMSSKDGEEIEAWVNMLEEDMDKFEGDSEVLPLLYLDHY